MTFQTLPGVECPVHRSTCTLSHLWALILVGKTPTPVSCAAEAALEVGQATKPEKEVSLVETLDLRGGSGKYPAM